MGIEDDLSAFLLDQREEGITCGEGISDGSAGPVCEGEGGIERGVVDCEDGVAGGVEGLSES